MLTGDTIVALSSAAGPAARLLLRLSGPAAGAIAGAMTPGQPVDAPPGAQRVRLCVRGMDVPAWVYRFRAPRSYTGEDLVELHLPGNPLLGRLALEDLVTAGARPAGPGEFTARAYLNGRIDLAAAEGVAALVSASNESELRAARQLLAGELARRLAPTMDGLAETLALLEAEIDFSDEDVTFLARRETAERIERAAADLRALLDQSARFERLSHEPRIVLIGPPNAGKSTLLNTLAGRPRAVVSAVAGTTRDVLSAEVDLPAGRVIVLDVAGIDATPAPPTNAIADGMRRRALQAVAEADVVVWVAADEADDAALTALERRPDLIVRTKADVHDRCGTGVSHAPNLNAHAGGPCHVMRISAVTGKGMDELRRRLSALAFGEAAGGSALALNARHVTAIESAIAALMRAGDALDRGVEVVALELREALDGLGSILGVITPDDLLGRIFSRFCIGK